MKKKHHATKAEVERMIRKRLERENQSSQFIEGYLAAIRECGWLAPRKPQWIIDRAKLRIQLGPPLTVLGALPPPNPRQASAL